MNNADFPAVADDSFFESLEKRSTFKGEGDIDIDLSWPALACRTTENPVAVASVYKKLIHDITNVLVGIRFVIS